MPAPSRINSVAGSFAQFSRNQASADVTEPGSTHDYSYKASLVGRAHRFTLTDDGVQFQIGRRSGCFRYNEIAAINLSYRPVSMQSRRFRADITDRSGQRIAVLSTTWQTVALVAPQDAGYRAFIVVLHERMHAAGSTAVLTGGLRPAVYATAVVLLALVGLAMAALLVRALISGEFAGALFLVGFAALFAWQTGGFVLRNRPTPYGFGSLPRKLLP